MAAAAPGEDGAPQLSPLPPGNLERFPQFCLHASSHFEGDSSAGPNSHNHNHNPRDSSSSISSSIVDRLSGDFGSCPGSPQPSKSRSPTASSVSTSATSVNADSPRPPSKRDESEALLRRREPTERSRRDKKQLHAARQQRSGSDRQPLGSKKSTGRRFQRSSNSSPADALAALEPAHDQGLARMTIAEQQRWITVQQKTFTKW